MFELAEIDRQTAAAAEEAIGEVRQALDAVLEEADEPFRPLVQLVNDSVFADDPPGIKSLLAASQTPARSFASCGLDRWRSVRHFRSDFRAMAVRALPLPLAGPYGCYGRHLAIHCIHDFTRAWGGQDPPKFRRATTIPLFFDVVSWCRRRKRGVALDLARLLVRMRPDAFGAPVGARPSQAGELLTAPANLLEVALRRPAAEIRWAHKIAFPTYKHFLELFEEAFLATEGRKVYTTFELQGFARAAHLKRGSASAAFALILGDNYTGFRDKRFVEAAVGLLAYMAPPDAGSLLRILPGRLRVCFSKHTGLTLEVVEGELRQSGSGEDFAAWIQLGELAADGRTGLETADVEAVRRVAGVLEDSSPGCLAEAGADAVEAPAVVVPGLPAPKDAAAFAEDLPEERPWERVHVLATALDQLWDRPEAQKVQRLEFLESPVLQEPLIDLHWHAERLGLARGAQNRRAWYVHGASGWHQTSDAIDRLLGSTGSTEERVALIRAEPGLRTRPMRWGFVHRWWMAPISERGPWGRLVEAATASHTGGEIYDAGLRQVGRGYRALEHLNAQQFKTAATFTACPPILGQGTDAWASVDYMNRVARVWAEIGRHDEAVKCLNRAIGLTVDRHLIDQEVHASLDRSKIQCAAGVPTFDGLMALAKKAGKAIRPAVMEILSHSALLDRIYFAESINFADIERRLLVLAESTDPVLRAWVDVARGLVRLRMSNPGAVTILSSARSALVALSRLHDANWVAAFLSIAASRAGNVETACEAGRSAALYFAEHSQGPIHELAMDLVAAGEQELATLVALGRSLIAPRGEATPALLRV